MKHTPGPWRIRRGTAHLSCVEVEVQDGDSVATVYDGVMGIDNAEANARLIAAAPALLEALKMVRKTVEEVEQGVSGEANYTHSYKVWTEAIREAIAAVEGEKR